MNDFASMTNSKGILKDDYKPDSENSLMDEKLKEKRNKLVQTMLGRPDPEMEDLKNARQ